MPFDADRAVFPRGRQSRPILKQQLWLHVALMHSPASVTTVLPFFGVVNLGRRGWLIHRLLDVEVDFFPLLQLDMRRWQMMIIRSHVLLR